MRTKKRIEINRFDNFSDDSTSVKASEFYNFLPSTTLKKPLGITNAKFPSGDDELGEIEIDTTSSDLTAVKGVTYIKQYSREYNLHVHRLLIYGDSKKIYFNELFSCDTDLHYIFNLQFDSPPVTLLYKKDGEDIVILTSTNKMYIWKVNVSPYQIENVPIITSMCMNDGILYCTINDPSFKIWYSKDLDAEKLGETSRQAGYITLADELGESRKILNFNEEVYVFRDYGISKITHIKDEIIVKQVYLSNTKIFHDTVNVCGNVIMFATSDGIYSFNGVKVSRVKLNLNIRLTDSDNNSVASSLGNKYYLALRVDYDDDKNILCENGTYKNNTLLVIDTEDDSYQIIRGVDIGFLLPVKTDQCEKMLVVFNSMHTDRLGEINDSAMCFDTPLKKYWSSKPLTDNFTTKLFTKLTVRAEANIRFNLIHDGKTTNFTTYTSGINEFAFRIYAKDMRLEISSDNASASVENVVLDYYEY